MKLVASLIVRNERRRYLEQCLDHLLEFCDTVVVVDDHSDDGTTDLLLARAKDQRFAIYVSSAPGFFVHEGRARQQLIDHTLAAHPTHVLSIDADEFVSDGKALRAALENDPGSPVWQLNIEEIWRADTYLYVREDGGWRSHGLPVLWKAPPAGQRWQMMDRKLACRRVPMEVLSQGARAKPTGVDLLHFGWANPSERQARYDRYVKHDGGRFHASTHLQSIMWPPGRIRLRQRTWPVSPVFDDLRTRFV